MLGLDPTRERRTLRPRIGMMLQAVMIGMTAAAVMIGAIGV